MQSPTSIDLPNFCMNVFMAKIIGRDLLAKSTALKENPLLGRPASKRGNFRQAVFRVLNATYIFQYRIEGNRIVILRVFHGREARDR